MSYALLHPEDRTRDGLRIIEINDAQFPVASPMFWADVSEGVSPLTHHYDVESQSFKVNTAQAVPEAPSGGPNVIA